MKIHKNRFPESTSCPFIVVLHVPVPTNECRDAPGMPIHLNINNLEKILFESFDLLICLS